MIGDGLIDDISARLHVSAEQVLVGWGSLALLQQTLTAYTEHGTEVIHAWRSYEAYPVLIGVAGATAVPVALDATYTHDVDAIIAATTPATRAVIVCNPNNPTGTELSQQEVERLIEGLLAKLLILLDEAYHEFATTPIDRIDVMRRHPNVVVFRTFSKAYGLAGLRAGYMIADSSVAENVRATSPPFGPSIVAEAAARAAWADAQHTDHVVKVVTDGREYLRKALYERGIATPGSGSNFVWIPVGHLTKDLEQACLAQRVSVRTFAGEGVRVTVGDRDAEDAILRAIDSVAELLTAVAAAR